MIIENNKTFFYSDNRNYNVHGCTRKQLESNFEALKTMVKLGILEDTQEYRKFIIEFERYLDSSVASLLVRKEADIVEVARQLGIKEK